MMDVSIRQVTTQPGLVFVRMNAKASNWGPPSGWDVIAFADDLDAAVERAEAEIAALLLFKMDVLGVGP